MTTFEAIRRVVANVLRDVADELDPPKVDLGLEVTIPIIIDGERIATAILREDQIGHG